MSIIRRNRRLVEKRFVPFEFVGPPGATGPIGYSGYTGYTGFTGPEITGYTGPQGETGYSKDRKSVV